MGSKLARTPNLDRMAAESLVYTRGYVMPVCSPSLACLLTGRLPHAHGIVGNDLSTSAKAKRDRSPLVRQLLTNKMLLPKALTAAGYRTLQTGKLWNATAQEAGFTAGMTAKEGRHGGDGLDIGRKTMKPVFDFIGDSKAQKKPFFVWYAPMMPHQPHNPRRNCSPTTLTRNSAPMRRSITRWSSGSTGPAANSTTTSRKTSSPTTRL